MRITPPVSCLTNTRHSTRQSGIELVKVVAIFLIVISHVTQTLCSKNSYFDFQDYVIRLGTATTDVQVVILTLFYQAGVLGNTIFFACSAWFLVGRAETARKKAFSLLCTVWSVSVLILCLYLAFYPSCLTTGTIISQLFPSFYSNNWYMTCYILFLFIYPWLNRLIAVVDQRQMLRIVSFLSFIWIGVNYFLNEWFYPSNLILWITIYFLIAYLKLYCTHAMTSLKVGKTLLALEIAGYIAQVVVTNYVGLYWFNTFFNKVLWWHSSCCPFYIMIAIALS